MLKKDREILDKHIFNPESIAVIGASNTPGTWGNNAVRGLLTDKSRRLYAVNPNADEIQGLKAYPSVKDIPEPVDHAVIVVTEKLVPRVLQDCVDKGVKGAVIITSGFGEMGKDGKKLESELLKIARKGGLHFVGPNSMGHADTGTQLSTFGQGGKMQQGPVAVLSQSGSTCLKIVRNLEATGIACSKYISTGNEVDLRMEDYLEYLADDDDTRIIAAYIEGLRDGRRFFKLAKKLTGTKPIVVVKVGQTEESARAVMSHTGALAGADEVYTGAFRQTGVIRTEDDDELCDVVYTLENSPLPQGNRVGILSIGGGPGALTAEICEREGLSIGRLSSDTLKQLDKLLSSRWPRRNPVDMAGPSAAEISVINDMLRPMIEDKNLDTIFVQAPVMLDKRMLASRMGMNEKQMVEYWKKSEENIKLLREKMDKFQKPIVFLWHFRGSNQNSESAKLFSRERMLVYSSPRRAARVMHHLYEYNRYLKHVKR